MVVTREELRHWMFKEFPNKDEDINKLKIRLANEATTMLHGNAAAKKAEQTAKNTFEKFKLVL